MYSLSRYPYQPLQSDVPQIYTKKPFRMTNPSVSICVPNAQLPQLTILHFTGMSHSTGSGGATPKPNYNNHFPRSFMLNYGEALSNLPDEKISAGYLTGIANGFPDPILPFPKWLARSRKIGPILWPTGARYSQKSSWTI